MFHRPPPDVSERVKLATEDRPMIEGVGKSGLTRSQSVRRVYSEYTSRLGVTAKERIEEEENHRIYTGIQFGQWPKEMLAELEKQGRTKDLSQFNFVMKKVNDAVGQLVRNWYDIDYLSVDGVGSDTVQLFKDLYYMDKDLCDWDAEINDFLVNGMIRSADLLMTVDYSYDGKFGNIGVKSLTPGSVLRDPNWTTKNSKNCRSAFTTTYLTAQEIKEKYKHKSARIDMLVKLKAMMAQTDMSVYGSSPVLPRYDLNNEYNKEYLVIEYHHMETEKRKKKYGFSRGYMVEVPLDADEAWYIYNEVNKEDVIEDEEFVEVYYITTICPDLDIEEALEDRKGLLQCGRLPIIHWSFNRHNGKDIGIVDLLKDPQRFYNTMLSLSKEIIAYSRRVRVVDPAAFEDDVADLTELEEKLNRPGATVFGKANFSLEYPNAIQEASPSTYTGNELNLAQVAYNAGDTLTPVNSAMGGQSGAGERSAEHFNSKREQAEVNMTLLSDSVKLFNNELAECYFYAAQSLYGGMYRVFEKPEGTVEVNIPLPDGRVVNDLTVVPRTKVVVTESPAGVTKRTNDRIAAYQAMQYMGQSSPLAGTYMTEIVFDSMDNIPESKRKEIKMAFELDRQAIIVSQQAQIAQAQAMVAQMQAPPQQQMPEQQANPEAPPQEQPQPTEPQQPVEGAPSPEEAQTNLAIS